MSEPTTNQKLAREPRKLPGAIPKPMSPWTYLDATLAPDGDASQHLPESFGLQEAELDRLSKDGIRLFGERFQSLMLSDFVTRRGEGRKGRFVALYDYADVVRGALDEIRLVEVEPHGRRRFLFTLPNVDLPERAPTPEEIGRNRAVHEAVLLKNRNNAQLQLLALRCGEESRENLLEAQHERRRRQRGSKDTEAIVSTPIEGPDYAPVTGTEELLESAAESDVDRFDPDDRQVGEASGPDSEGVQGRSGIETLFGHDSQFEED
jgi:hypothetical protein